MSESTLETTKTGAKIKVYATTWCGDCRFAKRWLDSHGIAYDYINIEEDENAAAYVRQVNGGSQTVPTIIFPDGSILVEPNARDLAAKFPASAFPCKKRNFRYRTFFWCEKHDNITVVLCK